MTAYKDKNKRRVAEESGCDNYYVKPIFKAQLQEILHDAGLLS